MKISTIVGVGMVDWFVFELAVRVSPLVRAQASTWGWQDWRKWSMEPVAKPMGQKCKA
jgi:hypothetical protein